MSESELHKLLNPFIHDLEKSGLSNLRCLKKHVELLLNVRAMGYSVAQIIEESKISYSVPVFSVKLSQIKRELAIKPEEKPIAEKGTFSKAAVSSAKPETKQEPIKPVDKEESDELEYSLDEWINNTRLSKGNINLFRKGEKNGLTPDDFKGFKNYNNITIIRLFREWNEICEAPVFEWEEPKLTKEEFLSKYKI